MRLRTRVLRGEIDGRHTGTGGIRAENGSRALRDPTCPTTLVDAAGRLAPGAGPSGVAASPKGEGTGPREAVQPTTTLSPPVCLPAFAVLPPTGS